MADKSRLYRERKIQRIGLEAFRAEESAKRQARRLRKKLPKVSKPEDQNLQGVARLYKYITGNEFNDDYEFFRDSKRVIQAIEDSPIWVKPNTKNKYLENLSSVFKNLDKFEKEYKIYSKASVEGRRKITKAQGDLKMTEKEAELFVLWKIIKKAVRFKFINDYERALLGLYTLMPPRRRSVGRFLTLADEKTKMLSPNLNYIVGRYIIINNYKTSKVFGQQKFKIPIALHRILVKHIQSSGIKKGDPIFPTKTGKYHAGSAFSTLFSDTFEKALGQRLTFNSLRHSFIIEFLGEKKTLNQKRRMAKKLAHSVATQAMYDRMKEARKSMT